MTKYNRYEYSLLELCERVHMQNTGAGTLFFAVKDLTDAKREIQKRINNWTPSKCRAVMYDDAVHQLCLAVLTEFGGCVPLCTRDDFHTGPCNGYPSDMCNGHR